MIEIKSNKKEYNDFTLDDWMNLIKFILDSNAMRISSRYGYICDIIDKYDEVISGKKYNHYAEKFEKEITEEEE